MNKSLKISGNQIRKLFTDKWCFFQISRAPVRGDGTLPDGDVLQTGVGGVEVYARGGRGGPNLCQQSRDGGVELCQVPAVLVWVKNVLLISRVALVSLLATALWDFQSKLDKFEFYPILSNFDFSEGAGTFAQRK